MEASYQNLSFSSSWLPIRYQLLAQPMFVHYRHRADCQRLTGSALVLNAITETQTIKLFARQTGGSARRARERAGQQLESQPLLMGR
jgi:hypothetical protein